MMPTIEIETAVFADATQKASRVSPTKGAAYDRAAGLVVEINPDERRQVTIKATDLETTFLTRLTAAGCGADAGSWRLPASVLAGFMAQLPMGPGATVTLTSGDSKVQLKAGRTKANLHTISGDFPPFKPFDETGLKAVPNLAQAVQQVAWACDRGDESHVFAGVHIDGLRLVACDRAKLAEVSCVVPVDEPITAPLQALSNAMKHTAEVRVRAAAKRLYLMTDVDTQATSRLYASPYPNLDAMRTRVEASPRAVDVSVEGLTEVLRRQMVLCKGDRYPLIKLTFADKAVAVQMDVPDLGTIEDEIDCKGGDSTAVEMWFTPTILTEALAVAQAPVVTISYADSLGPIAITDGTGYRCIAMPRRV